MKPRAFGTFLLVLVASHVLAHDDGLTCHHHPAPSSPFRPNPGGDGTTQHYFTIEIAEGRVAAAFHPELGSLAVLDPSTGWSTISIGLFAANAVRSADLDADGLSDVILASYAENAMAIVYGQRDEALPVEIDLVPIGPAPLGAEPVALDGNDSGFMFIPRAGFELVVEFEQAASLFDVRTNAYVGAAPLNSDAGRAIYHATARATPQGTGPNWYAVGYGGDHSAAACNSEVPPRAEIFTVESATGGQVPAIQRVEEFALQRGLMDAIGARLTGYDENPWFVFTNAEDPIVELVQPGRADTVLHTFPALVRSIAPFPLDGENRDGVLVTFGDGESGGLYEFDPALGGFSPYAQISFPAAKHLDALIGVDVHTILAIFQSDDPTAIDYAIYEDTGSGFQLASSGTDTVFSAYPATTTVMLYTDDPFGNGGFEFESFAAGHWATNASFDGPNVSALEEVFQGSSAGLGNPVAVQLTPAADPGGNAGALGNQWEAVSSSLFFAGSPNANGNAAVTISPPPGTYSHLVHVTFAAAPGTNVIYRKLGGPWQSAPAGGLFLAADTIVEYYGQAPSGSLSVIGSALYRIDLSFQIAPNGEWMPPAIASALGIEPGDGHDIDGDGFSNLTEALEGTDLHSPDSFPSEVHYDLRPLELTVRPRLPDGSGGVQPVPPGSTARLMTLAGTLLGQAPVDESGEALVVVPDFYDTRPGAGHSDLFRFDRVAPLLVSVTVDRVPTPMELLATVGVSRLPGPPSPFIPTPLPCPECPPPPPTPPPPVLLSPIPFPQALDRMRTASTWIRSNIQQAEIMVDPVTTLTTLAAAEWVRSFLETEDLGRIKVRFPWLDPMPSSQPLTPDLLALLGEPRGPAQEAYRLDELAATMNEAASNEVGLESLKLAAEAIHLEAQLTPGLLDPLHALLHLIATGTVPPDYAGAVTTPDVELASQFQQLLTYAAPREIIEVIGMLERDAAGRWALRVAPDLAYPLGGSETYTDVHDSEVHLRLQPYRPGATALLPGSTVRVIGFPFPWSPTATDLEVHSLAFIDADLAAGATDLDGDSIEDAFEQRFLNTTSFGFWDDPDGDLFSLGEEYQAGNDPGRSDSTPGGLPAFPRDVSASGEPDGAIVVSWQGNSTANYHVQASSEIGAWQDLGLPPVEVAPGRFEVLVPAPDPYPVRRFFRIGVSLPR